MVGREPGMADIYWIMSLITGQRKLVYTQCNVIAYLFRCLCCVSQKTLKRMRSAKKDYLLNKGMAKLERDLDIANIVRTSRQSRLLLNIKMDRDDQLLLKNQRANIIDSSDEPD